MTDEQQVPWQPITMLPTVAGLVDEMLDGAAEQQRLLAEAPDYNLDDATLDGVERTYGEGGADNWVFAALAARWQREHPGAEGLAALADQAAKLAPAYQRVLDLVAAKRAVTIEALLGKSDLQVGLEAVLGQRLPDA